MTHKEISDIEKRTEENLMLLHLFNNNGWWRAYEWSAYLCNHLPCDLKEDERLNPTKKKSSIFEDGIIFVGLKAASFKKYLPCLTSKVEDIDLSEKHIVFDVSELFDDFDLTTYKELLHEWKNNFKIKKSEQSNNSQKENNETLTVKEILNKIIGFRVECNTPLETMIFVSDLKNDVHKLVNK